MRKHSINNDDQAQGQLSFDSLLDDYSHNGISKTIKNNWIVKQDRKTFPINLVIDFNRFIDYIAHHTIELTNSTGSIPEEHLSLIKEQMTIEKKNVPFHTQQEHDHYMHLFYHIALAGQLIEKVSVDLNNTELRVANRWNLYSKLMDTEKYLFLLETFWVDVNWAELLNKSFNSVHYILPDVFKKLISEKSGPRLVMDKELLLANLTFDWNYFFLYLEWFGIWICENDQEKVDQYANESRFVPTTITVTSFGKKMVPILLDERNLLSWNIPLRREYGEANPIPGSRFSEDAGNLPKKRKAQAHRKDSVPEPFYQAFAPLFYKRDLAGTLPRVTTASNQYS
ncbi:hypothetical protein NC797_02215 [Aquibacillus sp. 3ASR75-11]|uniref:Uncharacterized protein n=1 Tax=Terrihalobacillus insolitus TaxID=2950438 RepID=A0A9X3WS83_9BACI|nr:hypothetical protein [Terrihalobacillus insolitus]MDC3411994.1 hypothetical protein [Terrihalobacillus insolitus]MDC3423321.1 hypothetical protein [Terrihalobacillus insolitus]